MEITDIRIRRLEGSNKMKAIVSITIDDEFVLHDIKVVDGEKGLFIAMPSKKTADGEYRDIAHPIKTETRNRIQKTSSDAETKTPLDKNSKVFYDFGLAFDLLLNEMSDSFNLYYNCENHFNSLFPAESEKAKNIQGYDLLKSAGIVFTHHE